MNERFWAKVDASGDCWLWTACLDREGYGQFSPRHNVKVKAHRFAYEGLVGPIPLGLVIDHLCRIHNCVNPDHLEVVTNAENVRRGFRLRSRQQFCRYGHQMDAENTLIHRRRQGSPRHQCRTCWAGYFRKYRAQKREAAAAA